MVTLRNSLLTLYLLWLPGCGNPQQGKAPDGADGVSLAIKDIAGIKELIASHKGKKIVVVDYWSTSCEPCMKEFPGLVKLAEKYPDDVAAISVSVDFVGGKNRKPEEKVDKVVKFLSSVNAAKVTNVLASDESDSVLKAIALDPKANVPSPPIVYVYARDGSLAKLYENSEVPREEDHFTYEHIEKHVAELVAKK